MVKKEFDLAAFEAGEEAVKQRNFHNDIKILGISEADIKSAIDTIPENDRDVWNKRTEVFHNLIKSARKNKMRQWHPDVCKDPKAIEHSSEINAAADGLLALSITPKQEPIQIPFVIFQTFGGFWNNATTVTNTSSTFWATVTWR